MANAQGKTRFFVFTISINSWEIDSDFSEVLMGFSGVEFPQKLWYSYIVLF